MLNMLRTMARGSMAPHAWNGNPWQRRVALVPVKKSGTILDRLRGGLSSGSAPVKPARETTHGKRPGMLAKLRAFFTPKAASKGR